MPLKKVAVVVVAAQSALERTWEVPFRALQYNIFNYIYNAAGRFDDHDQISARFRIFLPGSSRALAPLINQAGPARAAS